MILNESFFTNNLDINDQAHSKVIDKIIDLRVIQIEHHLVKKFRTYDRPADPTSGKKHYGKTETWIGLHPQALLTPYHQILSFLKIIKQSSLKIDNIVDLGAAYGRVGITMNCLLPSTKYLGLEVVKKRSQEASRIFERLELTNCTMQSEDILDSSFSIPKADVYFIYDFGHPQDIRYMLNKLSQKIHHHRFFLIVRGKLSRSYIQLHYPCFWTNYTPYHGADWSIYSTFTKLIS